jgi:hypothetical protein
MLTDFAATVPKLWSAWEEREGIRKKTMYALMKLPNSDELLFVNICRTKQLQPVTVGQYAQAPVSHQHLHVRW